MYKKLPESYYLESLSNKETVIICSILLCLMLILFIYHISKANNLYLNNHYKQKELEKIPIKDRKKVNNYYNKLNEITADELRTHKFGIIMSIFMFFTILTSGFFQYNNPNIDNYIDNIENISSIKINKQKDSFDIFVNLETNKIELFKINDNFYKKSNNKLIEIKNPNLFGKEI